MTRRGPRAGFSLIEVMVALTLLAIGLSTMVALSANVIVKARTSNYAGLRNAILAEQLDRLQALPYAALPTADSTHTYTKDGFTYTLTVDVTTTANTPRTQFAVTVTPANATTLARTVTIQRAKRPGCSLNTNNVC